LEKLNDSEEINRAWENIQGNFKNSVTKNPGPYDLKQHKHRFDEDQRKQFQMQ